MPTAKGKNRRIVIGVTGGIAAYKIPWLVREFVRAGASVRCVMTEAAREFVTPLTLSTLSGHDVVTGTFPPSDDPGRLAGTWHIDLGLWGEVLIVAPATANVVARLAHGSADDPVSTLALSFRGPVLVCPAMDLDMWNHPATQENVSALREMGYTVMPPAEGELASGLAGAGRLPDEAAIAAAAGRLIGDAGRDLEGKKILVTAGPTREAIDPVRFLSNRSSGKMGFAIASAAASRGASVTLVAGPVSMRTPRMVERIDVESASEMQKAVMKRAASAHAVIMAAAVADYTPAAPSKTKLKKSRATGQGRNGSDSRRNDGGGFDAVRWKETPDILAGLTATVRCPVVGFALETDNESRNAAVKLKEKRVSLLVMNNPLKAGAEFGGDTNIATIFHKGGRREKLSRMSKFDLANEILDRLSPLMRSKRSAAPASSNATKRSTRTRADRRRKTGKA
jgi:phosphopantothenoylcysteine decarboxylase/phosphopantothenate--cysteine ligase